MSRFVRPETVVLTLEDGATITVKKRLTAGERHAGYARMYMAGATGDVQTNPLQIGLAQITTYLIDWTLTDDEGQLVAIKGLSIPDLETVVNSLDPESFDEIRAVIVTHENAMRAERAQEKKLPASMTVDAPILPLPSAPAGGSGGFAH